MIGRAEFIRIVRDELKLPLANPDLEHDFHQVVNWRSVQLVRLFAALERQTGRRVPVRRLFEQRTAAGIYALFAASDQNGKEPER